MTHIDPSGKFFLPAVLLVAAIIFAITDARTLANPNSSSSDKKWAGIGLVTAPLGGGEIKGGIKATEKVVQVTKKSKAAWNAARSGRGVATEAVQLKQYNAVRNTKTYTVSTNGNKRIFDNKTILDGVTYLGETKGGKYQSWTSQLRDNVILGRDLGMKPALFVPPSTRLSGPLLEAAKAGKITIFDDLLMN